MDALSNIDLLSVAVAIAGTLILGFVVYFSDRKNATGQTFLWFAIITAIWSLLNYLSYRVSNLNLAFWFLRFEFAFGVWHSFLIFRLFYIFPNKKSNLPTKYYSILVPISALTSILCLTQFVVSDIKALTVDGYIDKFNMGPAFPLFAILAISFIAAGLFSVLRKATKSVTYNEKKQLIFFFMGGVTMFLPLLVLNFILPSFGNSYFVPLGAVTIFPFVAFTAYSVFKHHLFNVKVVSTAILMFVLSLATFLEIILTDLKDLYLIAFRGSVFILVLSFGILLIRSVLKEVEAREKIQKQEKEMELINSKLAEANDRQEGLIHFISHEVKGYLTKGRNAFSVISDGDYGQVSPDLKVLVDRALHEMTEGVNTVMNILDASNLKKGTITYKMVPFNFKNAISKVVSDLKPGATEKGLTIDFVVDEKQDYTINGDEENITKHVIRNLVDNAVRYTPSGNIKVELSKSNGKILFSVKDSGVGITEKDKAKLFTEGGKGTNSMKVNVNSTGYGLYIAKEIVLAHHGRIWAESAGENKGSQFFVEV